MSTEGQDVLPPLGPATDLSTNVVVQFTRSSRWLPNYGDLAVITVDGLSLLALNPSRLEIVSMTKLKVLMHANEGIGDEENTTRVPSPDEKKLAVNSPLLELVSMDTVACFRPPDDNIVDKEDPTTSGSEVATLMSYNGKVGRKENAKRGVNDHVTLSMPEDDIEDVLDPLTKGYKNEETGGFRKDETTLSITVDACDGDTDGIDDLLRPLLGNAKKDNLDGDGDKPSSHSVTSIPSEDVP
eukprot:GHVS01001314.1.p2 GENE.GHVS01001314.1~~GHVS01001314.1.p2  ORF type:complete len:241 (+),score=27.06 GHVS01001314.1:1251-1973(+)